MKKIYYWGPFIDNKIATAKAIYNSVEGINRYSKNYKATIINSLGNITLKSNAVSVQALTSSAYGSTNV